MAIRLPVNGGRSSFSTDNEKTWQPFYQIAEPSFTDSHGNVKPAIPNPLTPQDSFGENQEIRKRLGPMGLLTKLFIKHRHESKL